MSEPAEKKARIESAALTAAVIKTAVIKATLECGDWDGVLARLPRPRRGVPWDTELTALALFAFRWLSARGNVAALEWLYLHTGKHPFAGLSESAVVAIFVGALDSEATACKAAQSWATSYSILTIPGLKHSLRFYCLLKAVDAGWPAAVTAFLGVRTGVVDLSLIDDHAVGALVHSTPDARPKRRQVIEAFFTHPDLARRARDYPNGGRPIGSRGPRTDLVSRLIELDEPDLAAELLVAAKLDPSHFDDIFAGLLSERFQTFVPGDAGPAINSPAGLRFLRALSTAALPQPWHDANNLLRGLLRDTNTFLAAQMILAYAQKIPEADAVPAFTLSIQHARVDGDDIPLGVGAPVPSVVISACRATVASAVTHAQTSKDPSPREVWSALRLLAPALPEKSLDLRYIGRSHATDFRWGLMMPDAVMLRTSPLRGDELSGGRSPPHKTGFDACTISTPDIILDTAPLADLGARRDTPGDILVRLSALFRPAGVAIVLSETQRMHLAARRRLLCAAVRAGLRRLGRLGVSSVFIARDLVAPWV